MKSNKDIDFCLFSNNQGSGYMVEGEKLMNDAIKKESVTIAGMSINPDDMTTLLGYFGRPVKYKGLMVHDDDTQEMIFELGSVKNLFNETWYFEAIFKIAEYRIFEIFGPGSGRDFNFKNDKWK